MTGKSCSVQGKRLTVRVETIEGVYDGDDDWISIAPNPLPVMRDRTLHEVIHAVIHKAGLRGYFISAEAEEAVVETLGRSLTETFDRSRLTYNRHLLLPRYTR